MSTDNYDSSSDSSSTDNRLTTETDTGQTHPWTSIETIEDYDWGNFPVRQYENTAAKPYTEPSILAYFYWVEDFKQEEIGERYGVTPQCISYHMDRLGVPTEDDPSHYGASLAFAFESAKNGTYNWIWSSANGDSYSAYAHQILACVHTDPYEVFAPETDVHHETGHPLDNRPEAITVKTKSDHTSDHNDDDMVWVVEDGEPRRRRDPDPDDTLAVEAWWGGYDGDDLDGDDYADADGDDSDGNADVVAHVEGR